MSIDFKMAWRNIWRNKRRTVLTLSAIAFATLILVFMIAFQLGTYEVMINSSVKISTGHLHIEADKYKKNNDMRFVISNPELIGKKLSKIHGIDAYTYRANTFSLISSEKRTYGAVVTGIDIKKEPQVSTIKSLIKSGKYFDSENSNHAILGTLLAKNLHADIGDELTILGQGKDGSVAATVVQVIGLFKSGIDDLDRSSVQIPLKLFQHVYSMNDSIHQIVITGTSLDAVAQIKQSIENNIDKMKTKYPLAVLDWQELSPGLLQSIQLDLISGIIFYIILILVVSFSILNTFLMSIFERTKELGILMAIGTKPNRLTKVLMIESMTIIAIGIFAGTIIGILITLYFSIYGFDISNISSSTSTADIFSNLGISGILYPQISFLSILSGPVLVFTITFLTALFPIFKIKKLRPVEAIAHI